MNSFRRHFPGYVDCDESERLPIPFLDTADLLALDPVIVAGEGRKFSHYAMYNNCLMAVHDDGLEWWVVGYVEHPEQIDLPQWEGWKFRAVIDGEKTVISGDDVISSCAGYIKLRDGREIKEGWPS